MPNPSQRSAAVAPSPIRKFLPLVRKVESSGIEVIKLNVGDPDIAPDQSIVRGIRSYGARMIPYAPSPGTIEHTKAWQTFYKRQGIMIGTDSIIPTVGCAEAMLIALLATTDPGDEVLVFEPLYTSYKGFAALLNIKLRPITLSIKNGFALPNELEITRRITKKTRAILVINPSNPTGAVLSQKEITMLARIARTHSLFVIADETYREIVFGSRPKSFLSQSSVREHILVLDSASKRFSVPGARIGCIVSRNKEIMDAVLRIAMVRLSAPTVEQYALAPILRNPNAYIKKIVQEYHARRDTVLAKLSCMPGVVTYAPQGALYLIVELPVADAEQFILFMLTKFRYQKTTVLVAPASGFYVTPKKGINQIRIAYVVNRAKLKQAMDILARGMQAYIS